MTRTLEVRDLIHEASTLLSNEVYRFYTLLCKPNYLRRLRSLFHIIQVGFSLLASYNINQISDNLMWCLVNLWNENENECKSKMMIRRRYY